MKKLIKKLPSKTKEKTTEPETFICESCDKSEAFTSKEVEKKKKTDPDLFLQGFNYYIPCLFCTNGRMVSQLDLVFHQMAADLFGD